MDENKNKNNNQRYILTRETFGMTILLFCVIIFIMLLTREYVFSSIGTAVCTFMYGTFGYGSYLVLALLAYCGVWLVWEKKIKLSAKCTFFVALSIVLCFLLFHSVTTRNISIENYGTYLSLCYNNAAEGFSGYTFGGVVSALVVYPIARLTTFIGAYVIFGVLFAGSLYLSAVFVKDELSVNRAKGKSNNKKGKNANSSGRTKAMAAAQSESAAVAAESKPEISYADPYGATENYQIVDNVPRPVYIDHNQPAQNNQIIENQQQTNDDKFSSKNLGRKILFENGEFAAESYRRNMIFDESSYFNRPANNNDYMNSFGGSSSSASSGSSSAGSSSSSSASSGPSSAGSSAGSASGLGAGSNVNGNIQQTYGESYRQSVEKGTGFTPSSYVYGDKPLENLDDSTLNEGVYKEENTIQPEHEKQEFIRPEPEKTIIESNIERRADFSDYNEHSEPSRGSSSDLYNELQSDPEPISRRSEERNVRGLDDSDKLFSEDLNANSDIGGFGRDEEASFPERNEDDIPPAREGRESVGQDRGRNSDELFDVLGSDNDTREARSSESDISRGSRGRQDASKANLFDDDDDIIGSTLNDRGVADSDIGEEQAEPAAIPERKREMVHITPPTKEQVEEKLEPPKPKHVWKKYVAPPLDLLQNYSESGSTNASEIEENKAAIVETLANVRIESEIINVIVGSKFTRYDVRIKDNTAIKIALKHKDEIQIALRKDTINAYINFKLAALSIEVPNKESGTVGLKSMLSSGQFLNSKSGSLVFALGKNIEGDCICPDITKMPHLLVAGTTGSGKSICLSSLIVSLLYRYGPDELRFILVDPKQVEFIPYENLPHLMINEIIFDVDKAIKALNWAIKEMEHRYQLFKELTAKGIATKDINEYNSHVPEGEEKLPKIVIILDEFGDLMLQAKKEIETRIVRLVQKARACGIHLILATQRPSVDCITGLIKSNLPTRIGFKVNSFADSSTIFDVGGAEKLLGAGDMYYRRSDRPELQRVQGCFISSAEVQKVADFVKANNETYFDDSVSEFINTTESADDSSSGSSDDVAAETDTKIDDTFINALKYCVTSNQASVSMIQRRFPVGYIKACKIIDWMENMNYITQSEGSKPRKVLLSREEFTNIYGDIDD